MSTPNPPSSEFYFELSANGEETKFDHVEGISTEVALRNNLNAGENPFKFRIPLMPKGNLALKRSASMPSDNLLQWCSDCANPEAPTEKTKAVLTLKDTQGKSLLEWTLHSAHPVSNKVIPSKEKGQAPQLEQMELAYSFFTMSKK